MTELLGLAARWFGPMFDPRREPRWVEVGFWVVAGLLVSLGFHWIRRTLGPGPLERGEARWRYRDRSVRERLAAALAEPLAPRGGRTRGWWATRIEFGGAIALILGLPLVLLAQPATMGGEPNVGAWDVVPLAGYGGMLFGLWWMVRIYRAGLRNDAKATWRYRDRGR